MNSTSGQPKATKKQKSVIKGIIRKGQRKNLIIIIDSETYFVSITAVKKVIDETEEKTAIFGY
jgi:hypothetical protein